ncbi:MAG: helix-turn-helix domain-containing protein [Rubrobacter sp.]|nr:helix-turn-helix domain-containing protein [Rubrobacter sp.]
MRWRRAFFVPPMSSSSAAGVRYSWRATTASAPRIAENLGCGSQTVRNAIHDFDEEGLEALKPDSSRPKRIRRFARWQAALEGSLRERPGRRWRADRVHPSRGHGQRYQLRELSRGYRAHVYNSGWDFERPGDGRRDIGAGPHRFRAGDAGQRLQDPGNGDHHRLRAEVHEVRRLSAQEARGLSRRPRRSAQGDRWTSSRSPASASRRPADRGTNTLLCSRNVYRGPASVSTSGADQRRWSVSGRT